MRTTLLLSSLIALTGSPSCSDPGTPPTDASTHGDAQTDAIANAPGPLGAPCREAPDCISGVCLESEYGPPFCSRACTADGQPCPGADDAAEGDSLCVSYLDPPFPDTPPFKGELKTFCVPRCADADECRAANPSWEACDMPKWLGDPLYPGLGNVKVCIAPSYQGKDPVDPSVCDWDKTVGTAFESDANLCRGYCDYLQRCKELPRDADVRCCQWGCFNRMVVEGKEVDAWHDEVKCHIETHAAYPDEGPKNACSEPPIACCQRASGCPELPVDPTPPAAK